MGKVKMPRVLNGKPAAPQYKDEFPGFEVSELQLVQLVEFLPWPGDGSGVERRPRDLR